MTAAWPSTTFLRALAADLGWPAGWGQALAGLLPPTPPERLDLLCSARRRLLVASRGGRARLRAWLDAQGGAAPPPLPRWLLEAWIAERVVFVGDAALLPVVVAALCRVPAPVRAAALSEVAFLAVGLDSTAWTAPSTFADCGGRRRSRVVVLGPTADEHVVLHELGHSWHAAVPSHVDQALTVRGAAGLLALAVREGWRARGDATTARSERLADACAFCWAHQAESA